MPLGQPLEHHAGDTLSSSIGTTSSETASSECRAMIAEILPGLGPEMKH